MGLGAAGTWVNMAAFKVLSGTPISGSRCAGKSWRSLDEPVIFKSNPGLIPDDCQGHALGVHDVFQDSLLFLL